jgi:hypothetical protein
MKRNRESGMALISALLIMMLLSALLVGFITAIAADQQASGVTRDQTRAYASAHAGLEKLTSDLGALFVGGGGQRGVGEHLRAQRGEVAGHATPRGEFPKRGLHPAQGSQVHRESADYNIGNFSIFHGLLPNIFL